MHIHELETPALIVDQQTLLHNMAAMDELIKNSTAALRPHYKSHKCAALAQRQIARGAKGMTCAKLGEAEDLVKHGIGDILIANQIVQPQKIRRLATLAKRCRLTVCVDNFDNITALAEAAETAGSTIYCLVEFDIGMQRCGVLTAEDVLSLARHITQYPSLRFEGVQAYAGHISHVVSAEERKTMTDVNNAKLRDLLAYLEANGMTAHTVSGASTGTAAIKASEGLYTELQCGSYLFMDATYALLDVPFKNALFVLSTVVSTRNGLAVVDSGVKTCGVDQGLPQCVGFDVSEIVASEEHFQLHDPSVPLAVGDMIRLIPGHCCSTLNLHDCLYIVDGDEVINRLPITARCCGR